MKENAVSQRLPLLKCTGMLARLQPVSAHRSCEPGRFYAGGLLPHTQHVNFDSLSTRGGAQTPACRVQELRDLPLSMQGLLASKAAYRLWGALGN